MHGRYPSAQYLDIQNRHFLIDCGEGTQMQLMRYQLPLHRIQRIFISHLHGDHFLGLMGLIFTLHLQHRTADLHLYGHSGLDELVTAHFRHARSTPQFKIHFHLLSDGEPTVIFEDDALTVTRFALHHSIPCSGFLFSEKAKRRRIRKDRLPSGLTPAQLNGLQDGRDVVDDQGKVLYTNAELTDAPRPSRRYAYCCDTAFDAKIAGIVSGVDLLYHDATFLSEDEHKAVKTFHSTAAQAARTAKEAGVGKLLLGHFSARYKDPDPLLQQAREIFGPSVLAIEGESFSIPE